MNALVMCWFLYCEQCPIELLSFELLCKGCHYPLDGIHGCCCNMKGPVCLVLGRVPM